MKFFILPVATAVVHDLGAQPLFLNGARDGGTPDYSNVGEKGWCKDSDGKNFDSWYGDADAAACKKLCTKVEDCRGVNVAEPEDCALLFADGDLPKKAPMSGWKSFERGEAKGTPVSAKWKREEDQSWTCFAKDVPVKEAPPPPAPKPEAKAKKPAKAKVREEPAAVLAPKGVNFSGGISILALGALAVCMRCSVHEDDVDDSSRVRSGNFCRRSFSQYVPVGALLLVLFMYGQPLMENRSQQAMNLVFCWVLLLALLVAVECGLRSAETKRPRNVAEVLTASSALSPPPSYGAAMSPPGTYLIQEGYQVPPTSQMLSPPPTNFAQLSAPPTMRSGLGTGGLSYPGSRGRLGAEDPVIKTRRLILARIKDRLPEDTQRSLRNAFQHADVDRDGSVTVQELGASMQALGLKSSTEELRAMVAEIDIDGDGRVNMEEFMLSTVKQMPPSVTDHLLEEAFQHFDRDPEGRMDGKVDALDIHSTMAQMLQPVTYGEAKTVIQRGASGGKDHMDLRDWKAFVMGSRA